MILVSNFKLCSVKGTYQWSKWSHWSACNGTCQVNGGHGIMYRSRHCNEDGNVVALHFCREPNTLGGGDGEIPDAGVVDVTAFLDVAEDGSVSSSEKEYEIQACTAPGCIGKKCAYQFYHTIANYVYIMIRFLCLICDIYLIIHVFCCVFFCIYVYMY